MINKTIKHIITIGLIICFSSVFGQMQIYFISKSTDEAIPDLIINDIENNFITKTDENGMALLPKDDYSIRVYNDKINEKIIEITADSKYIFLDDSQIQLSELKIEGSHSKAIEIIKKVIENSDKNHIKSLPNYKYKAYTKLWADGNKEALTPITSPLNKKDSTYNKRVNLLRKSMLFLVERGVKHYFDKKHGEKNILIAERVSGIKIPIYEIALAKAVGFDFRKSELSIFINKFPNPASNFGLKNYLYFLGDTIVKDNRKLVQISFIPKGKKEKPFTGKLFIDLETYGLSKFIAERQTGENSDMELTINFERKHQKWIPKNIDYSVLNQKGMEYSVYQDSISAENDTIKKRVKKFTQSWIHYKTIISDFKSPNIEDKSFYRGMKNLTPKSAWRNFEEKIKPFRTDSLTLRESNTYVAIDSVGKANNINRGIALLRIFSKDGNLPISFVNLDLKEIYNSNEHEGIRAGLSLSTNHLMSRKWSLNGKIYYGFRDEKFKYSLGTDYLINSTYAGRIFYKYKDDVKAFGKHKPAILGLYDYLNWRVQQGYNYHYINEKEHSFGYKQFLSNHLQAYLSLNKKTQKPFIDYNFNNSNKKEYNNNLINLFFRYSPKEDFIISEEGVFSVTKDLPIYQFQIDQSSKLFNGDFDFTRIQASALISPKIFSGKTSLFFMLGKTWGKAPLWELFDGGGNGKMSSKIVRKGLYAGNSVFETMQHGEFINDKLFFAQISQQVFKIPFFSGGKLPVNFIYRFGIGGIEQNKSNLHQTTFEYKTLKKPFQELGLEINSLILDMIGVGFYYRIGEYQLDSFDKNFGAKIVISFDYL